MSMFSQEEATQLLVAAKVFFGIEPDEPDLKQTLNMNDIWAWACGDGERVTDEDLPEVAELFWRYGFSGILY